jgi:CheY-like chemotaxis protein
MLSPRILIVEDDSLIEMHISNMLEDRGFTVVASARTGREAISLASEKRPDIVIMDILLDKEMDGIEAAELIQKEQDILAIMTKKFSKKKFTT